MSVVRRFLVAPSLVRLIRKERGGSRISEGYFAPQAGRTSFVRIDGQHCHLVLVSNGSGASSEERTEVPRAHGDALLDVCAGKAVYERTTVSLGAGREALIDRYTVPAGLDLISVAFDDEAGAQAFRPPVWFGGEVSDNEAYDRHAVALQGVPGSGEITLTNAALDAVLDLIEPRFGFSRTIAAPAPRREEAASAPERNGGERDAARPASSPPSAPEAKPAAPAGSPEPAAAAKPAEPEAQEPKPAESSAGEAKPQEPDLKDEPAARAEAKPAGEAAPAKAAPAAPEPEKGDARIDDVIESLSQALGAAIQKPQAPTREDELAASFERWTVRPRRN